MKVTELLFFGVAGWCAIGIAGVALSLFRGRTQEALRHAVSIALAGGVYLLTLLAVSLVQDPKAVPIGQDQCFDAMCFAIISVDQVPGLVEGDNSRVVRVSIRVTNRGRSTQADKPIEAHLVDSRQRIWEPLAGISGNRLNAQVATGAQMLSRPMFRVAGDATRLSLVFTHGSWRPETFTIGDSESLAHRPASVALGY